MLVIENDWIEYEATERRASARSTGAGRDGVHREWADRQTVARRPAVRGGAACTTRIPAVSVRPATRAEPTAGLLAGRPDRRTGAAPRRRLRLTDRGRFVLVVLPALALLCGAIVTATSAIAEAAVAPVRAERVTVGAGDSLWAVAERVAPQRDPRDVVAELERANGLQDAAVEAGRRLVVPAAVLGR